MKTKLNNVIVGLIIIFVVVNLVIGLSLILNINKKIARSEEAARPAEINLTIIKDDSCTDCFDVNLAINILKQNNVNINQEKVLDYKAEEAQSLIKEVNIDKIPTFIATGELNKDVKVQEFFKNFGQIINDKFVYQKVIPIYIELQTGAKRGEIKLIKLTDDSCAECYDVNLHNGALSQLGIKITNSETNDITSKEGQRFLNQYDISLAPTIILQGDLEVYSGLSQIWPQIGEIAEDGSYVFTKLELMGIHKNIKTGQIINPNE